MVTIHNMGPDFKCRSLPNVGHTHFKSVTLLVLRDTSPLQYGDSLLLNFKSKHNGRLRYMRPFEFDLSQIYIFHQMSQ